MFSFSFVLPLLRRMQPDFVFSIEPSMVDYYKMLGMKAAHLDFGCQPSIHRREEDPRYKCNIAIAANSYASELPKYLHHFRIESMNHLTRPLPAGECKN